MDRFWREMTSKRAGDPWFDVFTEVQLKDALIEIQSLLSKYPPSPYPLPSIDTLEQLFNKLQQQVPPVGFSINSDGDPVCTSVDFRHIIYSGWVASQLESPMEFDLVNRLCQHAIMQQGAIDISLAKPA